MLERDQMDIARATTTYNMGLGQEHGFVDRVGQGVMHRDSGCAHALPYTQVPIGKGGRGRTDRPTDRLPVCLPLGITSR